MPFLTRRHVILKTLELSRHNIIYRADDRHPPLTDEAGERTALFPEYRRHLQYVLAGDRVDKLVRLGSWTCLDRRVRRRDGRLLNGVDNVIEMLTSCRFGNCSG